MNDVKNKIPFFKQIMLERTLGGCRLRYSDIITWSESIRKGSKKRIRANKLEENSVVFFVLYTRSIKGTNEQKKTSFFYIIIVHFLAAFGWVWGGAAGARGGVNGRPLFRPPYWYFAFFSLGFKI
jgi:hypothetical protein